MYKALFCVLLVLAALSSNNVLAQSAVSVVPSPITIYVFDDPRLNYLGGGSDMLTGEPKESIFQLISITHADPTKPITTADLPKHVIMDSAPEETFNFYSSIIDKSRATMDSREISVSGGGGYGPFKGSFSGETKTVNKFKSDLNTKIVRTKGVVQQNKYRLQTYNLNMTDGFRNRIIEISDHLDKNTPIADAHATLLADEVIRFFGTHVVSSITTGGMLVKIDSVDTTKYQTDVERSMTASASASFGSFFHIKGSITTEHTDQQKYSSALVNSAVQAIGGTWRTENWTYDNWLESLQAKPAVVEMHAGYILDYVRGSFFRDVDEQKLLRVRALMEKRLNTYLENNIYKSCNDPADPGYIVYANVYSPELCKSVESFHFGGMYTTSNNAGYEVKNILTEALTCPAGYEPKKFLDLSFTQSHPYRQCNGHWFWRRCHTEYRYTTIETHTYICHSSQNQTQGMYFGGVYTSSIANDYTQNKNCPEKYIKFPIYHDASKSKTMVVCMAPFDSGEITTLPFGGIFTSQEPNTFLTDYESVGSLTGHFTCPNGFERHPIQASPIAEVTYCIKTGSLNQQIPDVKPPGFGTSYADLLEFYPIYRFENGTEIGISVNSGNSDDYEKQVMAYALGTVGQNRLRQEFGTQSQEPNDDSHRNVRRDDAADGEVIGTNNGSDESYLAKWADANGMHHFLAQMVGSGASANESHPENKGNESEENETNGNGEMGESTNVGEAIESMEHTEKMRAGTIATIIGIIVGILLLLGLIIGGIITIRKRRRQYTAISS